MHLYYVFIMVSFLFLVQSFSGVYKRLSDTTEITHMSFMDDKIFYISTTGNHFGFIARSNGQIMTQYQLQPEESIIAVHKQTESIILRTARSKSIVFHIKSLVIQKFSIEIKFKHQKIDDILIVHPNIYVMTQKDVRMYHQDQERKGEAAKNIVSSARKIQIFKKIFLRPDEDVSKMVLVLTKHDEVCVRQFNNLKRGEDKCLFKTPYDIKNILRIDKNILIETEFMNYIISADHNVSSFRGNISQHNHHYLMLGWQFKTYDIKNKIFIDALAIEGSNVSSIFWIRAISESQIIIYRNQQELQSLDVSTLPIRSWITAVGQQRYDLILEFDKNRLEMFDVDFGRESQRIKLAWSTLDEGKYTSQL